MNILILGASSKNSIGYTVGEELHMADKHSVTYASRTGKLGLKCDVTNPQQVKRVLLKIKPDVVILAAGIFTAPQMFGSMRGWSRVAEHLMAKALGPLVLANAFKSLKTRRPQYLFVFGGRDVSTELGFAVYTVGNGALWSFVRFLNRHSLIKAFYIDLPFVRESTMEKQYCRITKSKISDISIGVNEITKAIQKILDGKVKRKRVLLGKKGSA